MKKKIFMGALAFSIAGSLALQRPCNSVSADTYQDGYTDISSDLDLGEDEYEGVGYEIENGEDGTESEYTDGIDYPIVYPDDDSEGNEEFPPFIPGTDTEPPVSVEVTADDIEVIPKNKKIHVGSSFLINIVQANPDEWEEYDEDVWEDAYEESIESIEFKSKKSYVAKVNSNGVVKGKHKGKTTIVTTIYFSDETKMVRKIKVTVKK